MALYSDMVDNINTWLHIMPSAEPFSPTQWRPFSSIKSPKGKWKKHIRESDRVGSDWLGANLNLTKSSYYKLSSFFLYKVSAKFTQRPCFFLPFPHTVANTLLNNFPIYSSTLMKLTGLQCSTQVCVYTKAHGFTVKCSPISMEWGQFSTKWNWAKVYFLY